MKTFPEFYIKGSKGYFRRTTQNGYQVATVAWGGSPVLWKSEAAAKKWLKFAQEIDPSAEIIDNTVKVAA